MAINYTEKGIGLHDAIIAAGHSLHFDSARGWVCSDEAAVQAIGHLGKAGEIVGAVVVTIAVFAFLRWQRRRRERKAERRAMARRSPDAKAWESDA
jgi:hypothetical protein